MHRPDRAREVLRRLSHPGAKLVSVAHEMGISERQARRDLYELYQELRVSTPLQAAAALGWVEVDVAA